MAGRDSSGAHLMTCEQRKRAPGLRSSLALLQSRRLTQVAAAMRMRRVVVALAPAGQGRASGLPQFAQLLLLGSCCPLGRRCHWAPPDALCSAACAA